VFAYVRGGGFTQKASYLYSAVRKTGYTTYLARKQSDASKHPKNSKRKRKARARERERERERKKDVKDARKSRAPNVMPFYKSFPHRETTHRHLPFTITTS